MKKIVFAAALSAGLLAFGDIGEFAKKVTFTFAAGGQPTPVRISETGVSGFRYSDCAVDGSDIRFADGEGHAVPFEIECWDPVGESLVWVKVPSAVGAVEVAMYYGGTPAETNDPTAVWTGYTGVWHLGALDTTSPVEYSQGTYANSTAVGGIDGRLSTKSLADEVGLFGKAFRTNDSPGWNSGNYCEGGVWIDDSGANSPLDAGGVFTISGWLKHNNWHYNYDHIFYKRVKSDNSDSGGAFVAQIARNNYENIVQVYGSGSSRVRDTDHPGPTLMDAWVHITIVFNGTTCSIYENGALNTSGKINAVADNDLPLVFGNNTDVASGATGDCAWNGWIDEVRYTKGVAMTADEVAAEYAAMARDDFVTAGEVVCLAPSLDEVTVAPEDTKASISGTIASCGVDATACDVYLAIGPSAEELGGARKIAEGVSGAFDHALGGLSAATTYFYELFVINNATPARSVSVRGSFTTKPLFAFRRRVTFTVGYEAEGSDALSGIPVLVKLSRNSPAGFRYSDCAAGGSDIRFVDADGKQIPFEIDTWDPKGESIVWVKPTTIAKGTTFTMYYKGRADELPDAREVWTDYSGVWHFGALAADATPYSQGLYPNSTAAEGIDAHLSEKSIADEDGRFGKSFRPNDSTGLKAGNWNEGGAWVVDAGENSPIDADNGKLTISGWVKHQNWNNAGEKVFYKRLTTNGKPDADTPTGAFVVEAQQTPNFGMTMKGSGDNRNRIDYNEGKQLGFKDEWVYVTAVFNGQTHTLYENGGASTKTGTYLSRVEDNDAPLVFGNNVLIANGETGSGAWAGWIDEVRYSKGVKSSAWVAAEYAAMADDSFLSAGEVEKINPPGLMILVR